MKKAEQAGISRPPFIKKYRHLFFLALIAALSFGLDFYAISKVGYGNAYYAAAIKSMTESFKNFFFVSFDPAGLVSVDKPPLGLWVQAVFVLIFGYHGWAMLLPQALAATGSCIMMYVLVAKRFGRPAGLISALVFAVTPVVVVAARNNTIDMQLILVLLVATWFLFKSLDTSKWRYLFICALFIGLGFNIKMLQAYLIVPAIAVVYLIFAKEKFGKRILAGLISAGIMFGVSLSWAAIVDLTPASQRPYVGSSTNNTVFELIIGHNGLERIYGNMGGGGTSFGRMSGNRTGGGQTFGQNGGNGGFSVNNNNNNTANGGNQNNGTQPTMPSQNGGTSNNATPGSNGNTSNNAGGGSGANGFPGGNSSFNAEGGGFGGRGGMSGMRSTGTGGAVGNDIGNAGITRFWNSGNYGQVSWLLIFAFISIVALLRKPSKKNRNTGYASFIYWTLWLASIFFFFSFAGFWHRYYLCMAAPAIAGLVGPGVVAMAKDFHEKRGWKQALLPVAFILNLIVEIVYVAGYTSLRTWLIPLMLAAAAVAIIFMALNYVQPGKLKLLAATGFMLLAMLAAPFYWAMTVVMYVPQNVTMPYAGPELASTETVRGMTANQETLTTGDSSTLALEKYLVSHYKTGTYLVVSQRADDVAQFIVDTGLPAVAYGGFLGSDNSLTLTQFKQLVKEGKITYVLISSQSSTNSEIISYVKQNATLIDSSEYGASSTSTKTTSSGSTSGASGSTNGVSGSSLYLFK